MSSLNPESLTVPVVHTYFVDKIYMYIELVEPPVFPIRVNLRTPCFPG